MFIGKTFLRVVLLFFLSFISFQLPAQKTSRYSAIDTLALSCPEGVATNPDSLTFYFNRLFPGETEKARAIYSWVANNITYDMQKYSERKNIANMILKKKDNSESAEKIFEKRKAVCEGYSNLIKSLCNKSGIVCEVVEGIGQPQEGEYDLHAWNAVKINNEWKLLDATWSAGAIDMKKNKFEKKFDDTFFLMPPGEFIKTHYPFDPMWQLSLQPIKRAEFELSKITSADTVVFHFNDTILFHFRQDSISQLIASCRRTVEFDRGNDLAKQNLDNIINYRENEKMNNATAIFQEGVNQYNECTGIINEAKSTHSTKKMDENELKLKQLLSDSRQNIEKAIDIYRSVKFVDSTNSQILELNIESGKINLNQLDVLEKYLQKYFNTPKESRFKAL